MKYLFLILITLVTFPSFASITFQKNYGGANIEEGYSVRQTTDGGYIITGRTNSYGEGSYDGYLVKTDSLGDTLWTKTFGGDSSDAGYSVQQTSDEGYIIAGWSNSFGAGNCNVYLVKMDSLGNTLWTKTYGGTGDDAGYSVQQTSDKGYIITGDYSSGGSYSAVYLIKTDSLGNTLWTKTFGGTGSDWGTSVRQTSDGGYIITGRTGAPGAGYVNVCLIKTDSLGNTLWTKTFGGTGSDWGYSVQQTSDEGYIIAGATNSFDTLGPYDVYLIKTNSSGDTLWTKTYGGTGEDTDYDWGYSVQQTSDEGYVIAGWTNSFGAGSHDVYLIKTDSSGNTLWTKTFGGTGSDWGTSVRQTSDKGYVIAGVTYSFGTGTPTWPNIYLIKTDENGNIGIEEESQSSNLKTQKLIVSPNPFVQQTAISKSCLPDRQASIANGNIIRIYDVSGKLVESFDFPRLSSGQDAQDKETIIGKNLMSGIYFVRIGNIKPVKVIKVGNLR